MIKTEMLIIFCLTGKAVANVGLDKILLILKQSKHQQSNRQLLFCVELFCYVRMFALLTLIQVQDRQNIGKNSQPDNEK